MGLALENPRDTIQIIFYATELIPAKLRLNLMKNKRPRNWTGTEGLDMVGFLFEKITLSRV